MKIKKEVNGASPKKMSKKKLAVTIISGLVCLAVIVTAIGFSGAWKDFLFDKPNTGIIDQSGEDNTVDTPNENDIADPVADEEEFDTSNTDDREFLPVGGEGDIDYERAYDDRIYGISGDLISYIRETSDKDFDEWNIKRSEMKRKTGISSPDYVPMLLAAIEEFNIPREAFEKINDEYIAYYESNDWEYMIPQVCYTQEEIDAIYSNDPAVVTRVFASNYAIIVGDRACAPEWYLNASESELQQYGISVSEINNKTDILLKDSVIKKNEIR